MARCSPKNIYPLTIGYFPVICHVMSVKLGFEGKRILKKTSAKTGGVSKGGF